MKEKIVMGILAHVDAGKTTLSESLLYKTGVIKEAGRVDSKNSFLDGNIQERERGITIYSKNARIPLKEKEIILIDTPGHVDFSAETERALNVLDAAILVVDASSKVASHTKTLWGLLKYYEIPVYILVNKIDMPGFDKGKILEDIKRELSQSAVDFTDDSIPEFAENIALCGEHFLNIFLEKNQFEKEDIKQGIKMRRIFPVFFASALRLEGIDEFINGLEKYLITPDTFGRENEEFSSVVYKITYDELGKRNSFMKILSGTLKIKDNLGEEKVNEIRVYSGDKFKRENEVYAGEICSVTGLTNSQRGTVYGSLNTDKKPILSPVFNYAVDFGKDADFRKMWEIISKLADEDPSLNAEYDEHIKEIRVSLMGDVQTEVIKRKLKDKYGVDADFKEGKIRYKETIEETVIGVGHFEPLRHYAEVQIKIEPLERGSGLEFDSELSEDYLDINWQKLVLTHLKEKEHKGVLTGSPLTDVKFTLVAGKSHVKHTEGGDFRQSTYRAVRQGLMKALNAGKCRVLEPYYDYTLELPDNYAGRAVTDINASGGSALINENNGETKTITIIGRVSASFMNSYAKEMNAYTKGKANLSFTLSGYDICHNESEVIENFAYNPDSDLRNPSSSVFCSHGAGTVVEWFDVDKYKHTFYSERYGAQSDGIDSAAKEANRIRRERDGKEEEFISVEEVDSILRQSSQANINQTKSAASSLFKAYQDTKEKPEPVSPVYVGTKQKDKYLLVDGYNVIHAWKELDELASVSMDSAAIRLNEIMSNYREISGFEIIVVYDAYKVEGHRTTEKPYDNITIVYTKEAQTADQYIERYAHQNSKKYDITVATSDGMEQIIVTGAGCQIISSREFEEEVRRTAGNFNEKFNVT